MYYTHQDKFSGAHISISCLTTMQPLFSAEAWKNAQRLLHDLEKRLSNIHLKVGSLGVALEESLH